MGANVSAMSYAVGFVIVTALLHAVGVVLATKTFVPLPRATFLKWSGSVVATAGVVSLGMLVVAPI